MTRPKMLYLVGAAATGKSSVMAEIHDQLGVATGDWFRIWPTTHDEFRGEPLHDILTDEVRGLSLGVTRDGGFSGTDAIGMASPSEAQAWIEESPELPPMILGEGQRLCSAKWFIAAAKRVDLTLGWLTAPLEVLDQRCEDRGSNQKPAFRAGSSSRAYNAVAAVRSQASGARVVKLDTSTMSASDCAGLLIASAEIALPSY